MAPNQDEVRTPMSTSSIENTEFYDEAAFHLDVTPPDTDSKKELDIPLDKNGRPMVKFIRWYISRRKRHCIVIGLILLFIIIGLLIFYFAIVPVIVQHYMDKVVFTINYMDITEIPNDSEIDVIFSVNLQYDVPVSATTDEMMASLIYNGVVFGTAGIGRQNVKSGKQDYNLTMNSTMLISDMDTFNAMAEAMMQDKTVPITASAEIDAHAMGLSFNNIHFESTLSVVGFNNFKEVDMEVQQIDLWGCSDGVYQLDVNVSLNNPSNVGMQGIGALNMSLYYSNSYLGYAYSTETELGVPRSQSNQSFRMIVSATSPALLGVITGYLSGGGIKVEVRGDNPYSTEHPQFKEAMNKVNMTVEYDGGLDKITFNPLCVTSYLTMGY
ncbi:hypothetical protein PHMEG_0009003 [Phytophthora megakarya]|uniref:Uncharacterized protein n=1 Tax=Phytophthora megakarya TaxID=4795 RepID=A0A225WIM7_9STRA|nr:hypothetical protein PHMEG_0009003 [Phytophthora megakarya]